MKLPAISVGPAFGSPASRKYAFTLLEVLVALGIIAGALAGIAALLPAAGARLAEATQIDHATTMVSNARADLLNRRVIQLRAWQLATGTGASTRAVVFGEGLTLSGTAIAMTSATSSIALTGISVLATRMDPSTAFLLRDRLEVSGTLVSGFIPSVSYGCMLSSTAAPTAAGAVVRMSTAVFRKPQPAVRQFALTQTTAGSPLFTSGSGVDASADRRRFLAACSWILATGAGEPRWIPIASSWTAHVPGQPATTPTGVSSIVLSGTDYQPLVTSGTLQAFGFEGLLRVDQRFVTLE